MINNNRYIQCGAEYRISPSMDPYQNYVSTGLNTGNLYIGYAVNKLFKTKQTFNLWRELEQQEVEQIRGTFDMIVMGASNFINPSTDFEVPAKNLEKLKLPVIVLGIGAQSPNLSIKKINLTKGTERFLHKISEYSESIGVRGEYTAELLNNMGIKNITIIGCPTYYMNRDINFKVYKNENIRYEDLNIALHYTNLSQKCDQKILKTAYDNNLDVIGQTQYIEEYWKKNIDYYERNDKVSKVGKNKEQQYKKILKTSFDEVKKYLKNHFFQFYDIDQWTSHIKKYNFVFGTRFHGSMIAVQNGIPALLVAHDSRTKELAEYCNIPYIEANNLIGKIDLEKLYSKLDYSKFNFEYARKFEKYVEFLKLNGVSDIDSLLVNRNIITDSSNEYVTKNDQLKSSVTVKSKKVSMMDSSIYEAFYDHNTLYKCPLENVAKLKNSPGISEYALHTEGLHIRTSGTDPFFILPNFINSNEYENIFVKIIISTSVPTVLELFYETIDNPAGEYPYSESRKVSQSLAKGKNEIYLAIESESPIKSLRLDIGKDIGEYVLHDLEIRA